MRTHLLRPASIILAVALTGIVACDETTDEDQAVLLEPGDPAFERDPALDVENVSAPEESRSHNAGLNCMRCHQALGPGSGRFSVAGTIYGPDGEPAPGAVLQLWTAPEGGEVVATVEADALGNVFSTEPLPLPEQRLFVTVESSDASLAAVMPFPISSGSCNHCHAGGFKVRLAEAAAGGE